MRFDIITIFPEIFDSYFNESMIRRAWGKKLIDIRVHNLRDFSTHKKSLPATMRSFGRVDDRPFGGGPGMVLKIESLAKALGSILRISLPANATHKALQAGNSQFSTRLRGQVSKTLVVLLSAAGKQFNSKMARDFEKKYNRIIMICGHYEGVDERIVKIIENWKLKIVKLSIGPYVLTGGELPAMVLIDAISRHIPGVLGKAESLEESRYGVGVPVYTRPEIFKYKNKKYAVPKVLLSGDHKKVDEWRRKRQARH